MEELDNIKGEEKTKNKIGYMINLYYNNYLGRYYNIMSKIFNDLNSLEIKKRYDDILYNMSVNNLRKNGLILPTSDTYSNTVDISKILRLMASNESFYKTLLKLIIDNPDPNFAGSSTLISTNSLTSIISYGEKMNFQYESLINILKQILSNNFQNLSREDLKKIIERYNKLKMLTISFLIDRVKYSTSTGYTNLFINMNEHLEKSLVDLFEELATNAIELDNVMQNYSKKYEMVGMGNIPRKYM